MYKKLISLMFMSLIFGQTLACVINAAEPDMVGWWMFDETSGTIAADSSGNGNDGILQEGALWTTGQINGAVLLDGSNDYVELPIGSIIGSLTDSTFATWVNWAGGDSYQRIFDFNSGTGVNMFMTPSYNGSLHFAITIAGWTAEEQIQVSILESGWHHVTVTIDAQNGIHRLYVDGQEVGQNTSGTLNPSSLGETTSNWLGRSPYGDATYNGAIDDFYIYSRVLLPEEIQLLMNGGGLERGLASEPYPVDMEPDALRDVILSWLPGRFADRHNVYLGTNSEDVNNADVSSPLCVSPTQDANYYDPGRLEFGQTYYWRVDEVNAPPDNTVVRGGIWTFTVEPLAYAITGENITATASSQSEGQGPENTINSSGLDADDLHSTALTGMWFSQPSELGAVWIQYDFDKTYMLNEMLVWNYNGQTISSLYGFKEVVVEYATDDSEWKQLENVSMFSQAIGGEGYAANTIVDFNNLAVKSVRITALNNYGGGLGFFNQYGLSEVRFMYIPVSARMPSPESGATDVSIDTTLGWRAGRQANEHNVYLSNDQQAVIDGTATVTTVNQVSYNPPSLDLSSIYYWRVDEVNNAELVPVWQSSVWSFTTQEYLVLDDFESYNDIPAGQEGSNLVYLTWIDGYDNPSTNGSTMGYTSGSSLETDITHGGSGNSVPLIYDNSTAGKSSVTVDPGELEIGSDWTIGSPEVLVVHLYGDVANNPATDQLYVSINGKKTVYEGDISRPDWEQFEIDLASLGTNLGNVNDLTIGLEGSGSGMIFLDNIELYRVAPVVEKIWIEAEDADSITAPMAKFSDDPNASGGQYIGKPNGAGNNVTASPAPDATATYTIEIVSGGKYMVGLRVYGYGTSDGFWVRIPAATAVQTADGADATLTNGWLDSNDFAEGEFWHWVYAVAGDDPDDPDAVYTLEPGTHTLLISNRDDGTMLDAISIIKID